MNQMSNSPNKTPDASLPAGNLDGENTPATDRPSTNSNIASNIASIKAQLPAHCQLVVVSKYRSEGEIYSAYENQQRAFAENRVQPLLERAEALPKDIQWHLIGHLQTNKVKFIAPFIAMIHSVDSVKLLQEINKEAQKHNRIIPCLVQLHVAQEASKFGLEIEHVQAFFKEITTQSLPHVAIHGLMAMGSFTDNKKQIDQEFKQVSDSFKRIKEEFYQNDVRFCELSIGMSSDYELAIAHGSTMVRVGSAVFAE